MGTQRDHSLTTLLRRRHERLPAQRAQRLMRRRPPFCQTSTMKNGSTSRTRKLRHCKITSVQDRVTNRTRLDAVKLLIQVGLPKQNSVQNSPVALAQQLHDLQSPALPFFH